MRFATIAAALLSVAAAVPAAEVESTELEQYSDIEERSSSSYGCVKGVHVIAIPGQYTTQGDMGYLETLVMNITRSIPHSNFAQIGYPKGLVGPDVVAYGIPKLNAHIRSYAKRCPRTKMVLASYSLGGAVDMDVLCGSPTTGAGALPKQYMPHILANVVYGDLTFTPGLDYNRGTCLHKGGVVERQKPGFCAPYGRKTHSYCDTGDQNCCSGNRPNVHFSYPRKYDFKATSWVVKRWQRFQRRRRSGVVKFINGHWTYMG